MYLHLRGVGKMIRKLETDKVCWGGATELYKISTNRYVYPMPLFISWVGSLRDTSLATRRSFLPQEKTLKTINEI